MHVAGKDMQLADTLSRAPLPQPQTKEAPPNAAVDLIKLETTTDPAWQEMTKAQQEDRTTGKVKKFVEEGWPKSSKGVDADVKPFFEYRGDLAVHRDLLVMGQRIYIPESIRETTMEKLHRGHLGLGKIRNRARETVWWPRLSQDLKSYIKNMGFA